MYTPMSHLKKGTLRPRFFSSSSFFFWGGGGEHGRPCGAFIQKHAAIQYNILDFFSFTLLYIIAILQITSYRSDN